MLLYASSSTHDTAPTTTLPLADLEGTIAVLSDPVLLAAHRERGAAIEGGDVLDADQLTHLMTAAGRTSKARTQLPTSVSGPGAKPASRDDAARRG